MWNIIKSLLGGGNKSPFRELTSSVRELIKGKEVDPNRAIELIHELNKAEAKHRSIFVAGWRPAIGWVGALILFFNYLVAPILIWVFPDTNPPTLDLDALWPVITGMLGIAGMRSYDKKQQQ